MDSHSAFLTFLTSVKELRAVRDVLGTVTHNLTLLQSRSAHWECMCAHRYRITGRSSVGF